MLNIGEEKLFLMSETVIDFLDRRGVFQFLN